MGVKWMIQNGVWVVGADIGDRDDQMDSTFAGREAEFDGVDGVGALNHATNPSYPNTELRMSRIKKNQDWAFCIWLYCSQDTLLQPKQTGEPSLPKTR